MLDKHRQDIEEFDRRNPSSKSGKKECSRCGFCCWRRPCDLDEEDVVRIAEYLQIDVKSLFKKFLVVDEYNGYLVVKPRRIYQEGGVYLTPAQTFETEPCIFMVEVQGNACAIHSCKPRVAKEHECWVPRILRILKPQEWTREKLMELGWDGIQREDDEE
jgi:Fe-S-cluster containining protein